MPEVMRRLCWILGSLALSACSSPSSAPAAATLTDGGLPGADASKGSPAGGDSGVILVPIRARPPPCPTAMSLVTTYCIDKWEDYVVELDAQGHEHPHSPYDTVDGLKVRAKTSPHVVPQGYISQAKATQACANAGKRLCSADEFHLACEGPGGDNWYPYGGTTHIPGYCNEGKGSMMPV